MIEIKKIYELNDKDIVLYAISDVHLNSKKYNSKATVIGLQKLEELVETKKKNGKVHILLLIGDIIDEIDKPIVEFFRNFIKVFDIVLEVRGNHELISLSKCVDSKILNIEYKIVDFGGFVIVGYTSSTKENARELKKYLSEIKKPIIILSHLPPYGKLDKSNFWEIEGKEHNQGDKELRKIWEEIKNCIIICGHVARQGGKRDESIYNIADFGCKIGRELKSLITLEIEYDSKEKIIKSPRFIHPPINFNSIEEFLNSLI